MSAASRVRRLALLVGGVCAVASSGACKETTPPPVGKAGPVDTAEQVGFGVRTLLTGNGVQKGELEADTMFVYNDQTKFDFRNARVKFNTETGAPNGTMKADRGRYDQRTQILQGWGHVVVKMVDGRELKSPHIVFNQGKNEISSDTVFEAVLPGGRRNSGVGFHSDPSFAHYTCLRDCKVTGAVSIPK